MPAWTGSGPLGELPDMPGFESSDAGVNLRPPTIRAPSLVGLLLGKCGVCNEVDAQGERLFRSNPGGALTCGKWNPKGCAKDEGDGMGCIIQVAALHGYKRCERGHWDELIALARG